MLLKSDALSLQAIDSISSNVEHLAFARGLNHRSVSLGPLENGFKVNGHHMHLLPKIQLQIFEHISMSFEEAFKIASEKGASIDWAYQYHDPSKDAYDAIRKWLKLENLNTRAEMKEKMLLNPTLKMLLEWKGDLVPNHDNFIHAVREGNLDAIKYFIANGVIPEPKDLYLPIRQGNVALLKTLVEDGKVKPSGNDLSHAVFMGKTDIVKYLISKITPTEDDLNYAIRGKNLDILDCLIEEGKTPLTPKSLYTAINGGNLEVFKHLIAKGAEPDQGALEFAMRTRKYDFVNYLLSQGKIEPNQSIVDTAIANGNLEAVKYAVKENKASGNDLTHAIQMEKIDIVDYLMEEGKIIPSNDDLNYVIGRDNLVMVKKLTEQGKVKPNADNWKTAIERKDRNIIKYLVLNLKLFEVIKEYLITEVYSIDDFSIDNCIHEWMDKSG